MSIIVNGKTISTNGDYIIINGVKVDRVNVVKNEVTTTVWEKLVEKVILDDLNTITTEQPTTSNYYTGSYQNEDVVTHIEREAGYYFTTFGGAYGIWYEDYTPEGWSYSIKRPAGVYSNFEWNKAWEDSENNYALPTNEIAGIRSFDVTDYKYCDITCTGDIECEPSSAISNFETMNLLFDDTHTALLATRHMSTSDSPIGEMHRLQGVIYEMGTNDWINVDGHVRKWTTVRINVSDLTGIQTLRCKISGSYKNGGWCRVKYIKLYN